MKKYFDNKKKIILSLIYSVLIIFCGTTFARWIWESTEGQRTDIAFMIEDQEGGYSCSADGGGEIIANEAIIMPAPCTSSENVIMREITTNVEIENKDLLVSLDLWLNVNELGAGLSQSTNFKYTVTTSATSCDTGVVSSGNFNGKVVGDKVNLLNSEHIVSSSNKYYLYIWLDEEETNPNTANQNFNLSLDGSCSGVSNTAEAPVLDEGMIPVVISDDGVVTTIDESDENWYNYADKKWANMVLVNENATDGVDGSQSRSYYLNNPGTTILESDILAYYTWIPRYKYRIWTVDANTTTGPQTINILFESKDEEFVSGTTVGSYRTHPAFWWDVNSDGNRTQNEMLPGIWVGKFETTGTGDKPTVLPNITSLVNQNVSTQFTSSLKFSGGVMNTSTGNVSFSGSDVYGLTADVDSHMMKNSEWGAVAYLSHSMYGINDEVRINNYYNEGTLTGCGALTANEALATTCGIPYGQASSYPQSTTGNITGVYDMSGGYVEYVMGVFADSNGNPRSGNSISFNSGFNGMTYDNDTIYIDGISFPQLKYYDLYNGVDAIDSCNGSICYGHALSETTDWYRDTYAFFTADYPWGVRGGDYTDLDTAGLFMKGNGPGYDYVTHGSWRSVLVPVETYEVTYDYQNNIYNMNTSSWVYSGDNSKVNNNYSYNGTTGVEVYSDDVLYTGIWIPLNNDKKINTNYRLSLKAYRTNDFDGYLRVYSTTTDLSYNLLSHNHGISINNDNLSKNQWKEYSYSFNSLDYGYWDGISIDYDASNQGPIYISDIRLDEYTALNINYGDNYKIPSNPTRTGYTFLGWYTEPNGQGDVVTSDTVMNLKENHTLYAHWEVNTYKISYSLNNLLYGLDDVGVTQSEYMSYSINNGVVTVTASNDDGYGFINSRVYLEAGKTYLFSADTSGLWGSESGTDTVEAFLMLNGEYNTIYRMDSNSNYSFTPQVSGEYWLRFDVNQSGKTHTFSNINISRYEDINVTYGDNYELPSNPTRAGYTFLGWNTKADGTGTTITSNSIFSDVSVQTVYAIWQKNGWTISYDANGGSGVPGNQVKTYGETLTLSSTVPTRTGYTFLGWSTSSSATSATYGAGGSYTANEGATLYAVWKINTYTITTTYYYYYQNTTWTHFDTRTDTVDYGSSFAPYNVSAPAGYYAGNDYGYYGDGYYDERLGGGTVGVNSFVVDQNMYVHVHYYPNYYTISYDANGGSGAPGNQTKYYATNLTLSSTVPTRTGYTFLGWSTSSSATSATYNAGGSYTANAAATLYAVWELSSPVESYSCANASSGSSPYLFTYTGNCTVIDDGDDNWRVKFLTSGTLTSTSDMIIDVFLVGGGGGGQSGSYAAGGGGGYTQTVENISLSTGVEYSLMIGEGGGTSSGAGSAGGESSAFRYSVSGGEGGSGRNGGDGGSGGGGFQYAGGSNGSDGSGGLGGSGQRTTTCEFGMGTYGGSCDSGVTMYAGGGGGQDNKTSSDGGGGQGSGGSAAANTGGGGGGAYRGGGRGGSGIVIIRNARNIYEYEIDFDYTGEFEYIDDGNSNWRIKFLTSGTFTVFESLNIDVFLVGGGGGGGTNSNAAGGGGGYTQTVKNISLSTGVEYSLVIGEGGGTSSGAGSAGGESSAFGYSASGGEGGSSSSYGGDGGSGGGGFQYAGGSNGSNGSGSGGAGQGTTTCEFGMGTYGGSCDSGVTMYAGGGGGQENYTTSDGGGGTGTGGKGLDNAGGGGGGAYRGGGRGGSGIVIVRNKR